jgi:ribulose-5-phosphate 4-epimerase/fuculose-1-phosphate aldolase
MTSPAILRNTDLGSEAVWKARVDLAACFRAAARLGLHEGVCNHLSFMVPGRDDLFLVNPDGWSFAEITASRLLVCDFQRRVVAGEGAPEDTAFFIHARIHKQVPRARAAFHTHMPNATALAMVEGEPLLWAGQSSLKFHGRTVVDDAYNGLALDETEGDRIAAALRMPDGSDADVLFMKHHGVLVVGPSIAKAWDDLYYLERACEVQRLAQASGRPLLPIPPEIAARTALQMRTRGARESAALHLESVKRQLDRDSPEYRQ